MYAFVYVYGCVYRCVCITLVYNYNLLHTFSYTHCEKNNDDDGDGIKKKKTHDEEEEEVVVEVVDK